MQEKQEEQGAQAPAGGKEEANQQQVSGNQEEQEPKAEEKAEEEPEEAKEAECRICLEAFPVGLLSLACGHGLNKVGPLQRCLPSPHSVSR